MIRYTFISATLLILFLIIIGCSGDGRTPVEPGVDSPMSSDQLSDLEILMSDKIADGMTVPMLFGVYEVEIHPDTLSGDIYPLRQGALGDAYHVDITPFLTVTPCSDCIDIKSIGLTDENYLEVTFRTKHPFAPGNRLDLHVFDLRGYIVSGQNIRSFDGVRMDLDGDGIYESTVRGNVSLVRNADGYSSFYDAIIEGIFGPVYDGNIYPFKCLWLNPATELPDTNYNPEVANQYGFTNLEDPFGHNVFPMGGGFDNPLSETTYTLDFSDIEDTLHFSFILEASYGATTRRFNRREPRYFLPEFHRKDAWMVQAGLVHNELAAGSDDGFATLHVNVMDWQAGLEPASNWDYQTSNLREIRYASDVKSVIVHVPGVLNNPFSATLNEVDMGDGSYESPYLWSFDIVNENRADTGIYWGIVAVRDDLEGRPEAPYGVSSDVMNPIRLSDITTYQAFDVFVDDPNMPPIAELELSKTVLAPNELLIALIGSGTHDPDGYIVRYEYDFYYSGDPSTFNPMITQEETDPDFGDFVFHFYSLSDLGEHLVAFRVTDNLGATGLDYEQVLVVQYEPPVADIIVDPDPVRVCADVTASVGPLTNDPDGVITRYEYDFYYTGVAAQFNPMFTQNSGSPDFGDPVIHQYDETDVGNHLVALRVTSSTGLSDIDFENIEVRANQAPTARIQHDAGSTTVEHNDTVNFRPGTGTNDPDGYLTKYEWDFDYDGSNFVADVTQNHDESGFGVQVPYQFQNTGTNPISVAVAFRVTDDGCPDLTDMDVVNFTVEPSWTGLPIIEDFETTQPGQVPSGWGVTGRFGNAYYLSTNGTGCTNTMWRWGVTNNASQGSDPSGSPGESRFLSESGYTHAYQDETYTYQNRATIVYTPEFVVPAGGATLTIRHWYDMTYADHFVWLGFHALDGGRPVLSVNNPSSPPVWSDFCRQDYADHRPRRPLNVESGPGYNSVANTTSGNHPLNGMQAHTHSSTDRTPSWRTNKYDISGSYAGQTVRVGFLFASDDIDMSIPDDCHPDGWWNYTEYGVTIFIKTGWRIHWVKVEAN